jgi:hypothetical protein
MYIQGLCNKIILHMWEIYVSTWKKAFILSQRQLPTQGVVIALLKNNFMIFLSCSSEKQTKNNMQLEFQY